MRWKAAALLLTAVMLTTMVIAGCGGDNPLDPDKPRRGVATGLGGLAPVGEQLDGKAKPPPPPPPAPPSNGQAVPPPPPPIANGSDPTPPNPTSDPNVERVAAVAGVTGKGQYAPGIITTPIAAYFSVRERVVFDIQIASAMNLYKATNGYYPKTHEEFMQKIVKQNMIQLPKLRTGDSYVYVPEKAAEMRTYDTVDPPLMVERAKR